MSNTHFENISPEERYRLGQNLHNEETLTDQLIRAASGASSSKQPSTLPLAVQQQLEDLAGEIKRDAQRSVGQKFFLEHEL